MNKKPILLIFALFTAFSANATQYSVGSAEEIAALKSRKAGDTVVLRAGTYTDQAIVFNGIGTKESPVVLMGEKPGAVVLTGASQLSFGGDYVVVRDLWFKDVVLPEGSDAVINFKASKKATNSLLTECAITGAGLQESLTDYKWVSMHGTNNTVSRCTFTDKRNMGTLLVVWFEKDVVPSHTIEANYFSRPLKMLGQDGKAINGQETVRIGTSSYSMQSSKCIVRSNYFFRCNGETEIVSNKSCDNLYTNNTFTECDGCLTLRHGNGCTVEGNYFFGNNVANTGGVRIIGEQHKIYNNYFQNLTGKGYTSAICVVQGIKDSPLSGYFKAMNVDIVFNTIIDCKAGISLNYGSARQNEAVRDITIAENIIYNTTDPKSVGILYVDTYSPQNIRWNNNICYGSKLSGIDEATASVAAINPALVDKGGLMRPVAKSPINKYTTKDFNFVTCDITGAPRKADAKAPGAFNPGSSEKTLMPTKDNSGTSWKQK